jgi:hypothetical protein
MIVSEIGYIRCIDCLTAVCEYLYFFPTVASIGPLRWVSQGYRFANIVWCNRYKNSKTTRIAGIDV